VIGFPSPKISGAHESRKVDETEFVQATSATAEEEKEGVISSIEDGRPGDGSTF
jgi:hypothetical protein